MSTYCPRCGGENKDAARFCKQCGQGLAATTGGPIAQPYAPAMPMPIPWTPPAAGRTGLLPSNALVANRYLIRQRVGRGGMGAVYDAIDTRTQRRVALKEMSEVDLTSPLERQQAIMQFQQEAQMLANLDHPNLPKVTDVFEFDGKRYLAMDFIEGITLADWLEQRGPAPEAQVRRWAIELCDVLSYLHAQHIIFRDLKPGNIMIDRTGRVKLIDFGIARLFKPGKARDTISLGTLGYAAPEQTGSAQSDPRTDIYALGVTLHQLLTGHDPTTTPMNLPPLRQLQPAVSTAMDSAIKRAIDTDRNRRWPNAIELRVALTGSPPSALPSGATNLGGTVPMGAMPINTGSRPTGTSRPTTRLLMAFARLSNTQLALALGALFVLAAAALWLGTPLLMNIPEIWNNLPSIAIIAPLVYTATQRRWVASIAQIAFSLMGAVITGSQRFTNSADWKLPETLLAALVAALLIEGFVRQLPKVRGQRRDEAWLRELAWLDVMAICVSALMLLPWSINYVLNPVMWIGAIVMGSLGWFAGDSVQQYLYLKQTGIQRGRGGN